MLALRATTTRDDAQDGYTTTVDTLRWILLGLGVLFVIAVYVWERRRGAHRTEVRRRRQTADDADLTGELQKLSGWVSGLRSGQGIQDEASDDTRAGGGDAGIEPAEESVATGARDEALTVETPTPDLSSEPDKPAYDAQTPGAAEQVGQGSNQVPAQEEHLVIALTVMARNGRRLDGAEVSRAVQDAGMEFGDMGIFHRLSSAEDGAVPLFSLADVLKPGYFDPERIGELRTPGLALFMELPGPAAEATTTFRKMVATGERLAAALDAELCDDQRRPLSHQRFRALWDRVLDFEARQHEQGRLPLDPE